MSDNMRWRYGETEPVISGAVPTATVIEIGDLIYQSSGLPYPASSQSDQESLLNNQDTFADNFLGVAMQRSRNGDTDGIRVATAGVFEFPCASANFDLGDMLGAVEVTAANALEDQKLVEVSGVYSSVGKVAKYAGVTAVTTVFIKIRSTIMSGEAQAATASS